MVRCVTFEIRWHDTLPIYSCAFQPIAPGRLAKVLDHNLGQGSEAASETHAPILAGGQSWRLATAGGDNNVRIWIIHPHIPSPSALAAAGAAAAHPPRAEYAATLARHTGVVNVVRFSPGGDVLASAGDDGTVLFWTRSEQLRPAFGEGGTSGDPQAPFEKEAWRVRLMSRATSQELYDMAWSPDGDQLAVGGTDFAVRLINTADGTVVREIADHQHYVQGVAWDPLNEFLATQSSDRAVHLYRLLRMQNEAARDVQLMSRHASVDMPAKTTNDTRTDEGDARAPPSASPAKTPVPPPASPAKTPVHTAPSPAHVRTPTRSPSPAPLPAIRPPPSPRERWLAATPGGASVSHKLYGDDRYSSFFRRLAFSTDGALLATPTGQYTAQDAEGRAASPTSAVWLYARGNFEKSHAPMAALPGHKTATLAVAFSPILYRLRDEQSATRASPSVPLVHGEVHTAALGVDAAARTFALPYRMVYAVATLESVWVYDTQQSAPLCCFSNLHYAPFTDLSWSPDGQVLMMSSTDGYCSVAVFDYNELGRPYHYASQPSLQRTLRPEALIPTSRPTETPAPAAPAAPATAAAPAAPATSDASTAPAPSPAPEGAGAPKKKRRVALTYEGPLPG
ncbi:Chromatin assembly factor 1 subunit [Malassezia brasiliensis]|uniref:Chromatin assembly factor 1 subunit n=1 Tax=Malassezia brasiliensis TaxID=1821822 RepID=A0AAF0DSM2_9BASI|nr:Chromatin assembly factor 1 subunit [Malassezia brasiliensis]